MSTDNNQGQIWEKIRVQTEGETVGWFIPKPRKDWKKRKKNKNDKSFLTNV
jgi:hypothetical protein